MNECVIGTLIRRTTFLRVGGFRPFSMYEDWDLFLRAWDDGGELFYVEDAVYVAHVSDGSRNQGDGVVSYTQIWAEHLDRVHR